MPVAVPLIAAGVGAAGSALASRSQSRAAQSAAQASQEASDASIAEQRRQYDLSRADQMPWLQAGRGALGTYSSLLGQNGSEAQGAAMQQFQASPDYNFRLNEGARALTARNAALGIQDSGAAQRSALQYGQGLASSEYGNWANRLASLAGVGQTAANTNAQIGQNYAGSVSNILQNNAQNLSSSYAQQGQANAGLWGTLAGIGTGVINNYPWGR